ncbi:MAG: VCBS repeat-containing protein [Nitrospinae bacterium]|nr:VCBS repeat-containing protein [Nitrospinota bacterium]
MIALEKILLMSLSAALVVAVAGPYPAAANATPGGSALMEGLAQMRPRLQTPSGSVISVKGGEVFIAKTSPGQAVPAGMRFSIVRDKEQLFHPVTREKLGTITEPVGDVKTLSDDGKIIKCAIVSGKEKIKPGDYIGVPQAPTVVAVMFFIPPGYPEQAALRSSAINELSNWRGLAVAPPMAVERLIFDRGIADAAQWLKDGANRSAAAATLGARYALAISVKTEKGRELVDIVLYSLDSGEALERYAGMAGQEASQAVETRETKKPVAAPVIIPAPTAPEIKPAPKEVSTGTGFKSVTLARLDGKLTALWGGDIDADGVTDTLAGLDNKVILLHMTSAGTLEKAWEHEAGRRLMITGFAVGDHDGDGVPEIYVNALADGAARSFVMEKKGGVYAPTIETRNMLFYAGSDGRLYGQRQRADLGLEDKILLLTRSGAGFIEKPFANLPGGANLSGLAFSDMDGDGAIDMAGFDGGKNFAYFSSALNSWVKVPGQFGGSEMAIKLPDAGELPQYFEIQPQVAPAGMSGEFAVIIAAQNVHSLYYITAAPVYGKSRVHYLVNGGLGYEIKFSTPITDGVIFAMAPVQGKPGHTLAGKTETHVTGPDKSELILYTAGE